MSTTKQTKQLWSDNRSGPVGRLVGTKVLQRIEKATSEQFTHVKGTVFETPTKVVVARVCTNDVYVQKGYIHWCNVGQAQFDSLKGTGKEAFYLFITLRADGDVHYWLVPAQTVGKALKKVTPKKQSGGVSYFLKVAETDEGKFVLANQDVTDRHETFKLDLRGIAGGPALIAKNAKRTVKGRKIARAKAKAAKAEQQKQAEQTAAAQPEEAPKRRGPGRPKGSKNRPKAGTNSTARKSGKLTLEIEVGGQRFQGTATLRPVKAEKVAEGAVV